MSDPVEIPIGRRIVRTQPITNNKSTGFRKRTLELVPKPTTSARVAAEADDSPEVETKVIASPASKPKKPAKTAETE